MNVGPRLQKILRSVGLIAFVSTCTVQAEAGGDYELAPTRIDGGGTSGSVGGPFDLRGTVGQSDAGALSGGSYDLLGGLWRELLPPASMTPTATASATPEATLTRSPSHTPTQSPSATRTPTPTEIADATGTPTRTETLRATRTRTVSPSSSPTSTAIPTSSATQTRTSAAITPTATTTSIATATSTASVGAGRGDVNCDGRVSAADLVALWQRLAGADVGPCQGADVDDDGLVDENDLDALVRLLFAGL